MPGESTKSSSAFFCGISNDSISVPKEKGSDFFIKLNAEINRKANDKNTSNLHRVLLKDKVFKNYIFCGLISLNNLPEVTLETRKRYQNANIQTLVIHEILTIDEIVTLSTEKFNYYNSAVTVEQLVKQKGNFKKSCIDDSQQVSSSLLLPQPTNC